MTQHFHLLYLTPSSSSSHSSKRDGFGNTGGCKPGGSGDCKGAIHRPESEIPASRFVDELGSACNFFLRFSGEQVPLYVATKMASIKRSSFFVPSPTGYAKAGLRCLGYDPRCTPYWPHSVIWGLLYSLPEFMVDSWRLGFCLQIRKRGQLKDSRKKE